MPALEWITIKGFRSLKSVEHLKLGKINVIIGANGSGKSNFIGVFGFLNAIREGRLKEYVGRAGGANSLLYFGSKITKEITLKIAFDREINQYEINLYPTENDELQPLYETVFYWDRIKYDSPYDRGLTHTASEAGISQAQSTAIAKYVQAHLDRWRVYHFHDTSRTSPMKQTADLGDNRYLRSDASNLAPFLYMLKNVYPVSYQIIVGTVRNVAPFFDDFELSPTALNEDKIRLEWKHKSSDAYFSSSSLSDGSIRFIALATLLLQPAALRPSVILIDEPELGLHPFALTVLAGMIRQASDETQIIVSTQSALLLDHFDPEEVLVADRVEDATQFVRLSAADLGQWLEEFSLGQLWEKAEFGGRPRSGTEVR